MFNGDFASWEEASRQAHGYDDEAILTKVRNACREVKAGSAIFERDSVLFHEPEYVWPVLSCLNYAAACNQGRLIVYDFGGSLGSFYFQHRRFLDGLDVNWTVIEQPHYVKVGNEEFATDRLSFIEKLPEAVYAMSSSVLLLSSVLQYLREPHQVLEGLLAVPWSMVLLDRTAFTLSDEHDRLTVQSVPPEIYCASYPAWFFAEERFNKCFSNFELLATWKNTEAFRIPGANTVFKGMCYARSGTQ